LITLDEAETAKLGDGADLQRLVQKVVDGWNRDKASFEQVKRFTILPRDFSAEEDEVTPTMKLRRKIVAEHFADEIEELYAAPSS
jgi:long-chain acyl-CoA synthetase